MIAKTLFRCAGLLALASSAQLSAAQTAQCLTEPEMRGLITYGLPALADAVVKQCGPQLSQQSFLNTRGPRLVADLRIGQNAAWPAARDALVKMGSRKGNDFDLFSSMPESVAGPLLETVLQERLVADIKPQNCKDIDRVLTTLAPLPSSNFVDLVTEAAIIAARDNKNMPSCPRA